MVAKPETTMHFKTSKETKKPVFDVYTCRTLLDTGADIPVVSLNKYILETSFHGICKMENAFIGGFGGRCYGKIYELKDFHIGELTYSSFEVFVPDKKNPTFTFILPPSMFYGTKLVFDTENNDFSITLPENFPRVHEYRLKDIEGQLYAQIDGVLLQDDFEDLLEEQDNFTQLWDM